MKEPLYRKYKRELRCTWKKARATESKMEASNPIFHQIFPPACDADYWRRVALGSASNLGFGPHYVLMASPEDYNEATCSG